MLTKVLQGMTNPFIELKIKTPAMILFKVLQRIGATQ